MLLTLLKLTLVLIFTGDVFPPPIYFIVFELTLIVFKGVPLITAVPTLHSFVEAPHIQRRSVVDFLPLSVGQIIAPVPIIGHFFSGEDSLPECLVHAHLALIEGSIFLYKKGLPTFSKTLLKAALINRSVIID